MFIVARTCAPPVMAAAAASRLGARLNLNPCFDHGLGTAHGPHHWVARCNGEQVPRDRDRVVEMHLRSREGVARMSANQVKHGKTGIHA